MRLCGFDSWSVTVDAGCAGLFSLPASNLGIAELQNRRGLRQKPEGRRRSLALLSDFRIGALPIVTRIMCITFHCHTSHAAHCNAEPRRW